MKTSTFLLIFGLVCPAISWLSVVNWMFAPAAKKRNTSFLFIPFIGPLLLSCWVILARHSPRWIPLVWLCDIGTIGFLHGMANFLKVLWNNSSFNQIMKLTGDYGDQSVEITLYKAGNYALRKLWRSPEDPAEICSDLDEPGTFQFDGDMIVMRSNAGVTRQLTLNESDQFVVDEDLDEQRKLERYSLAGWILSITERDSTEME